MKKFINDIINFKENSKDYEIKKKIELLENELEISKKNNDIEGIKYLEKRINQLKNELDNNFIKKYLDEIKTNDKNMFHNSITTKMNKETKEKLKEISTKIGIKQGELLGSLITYFIKNFDNFCKENKDLEICKDN